MGKSPGKWIKTLIFGKKATRSRTSKERSASKAYIATKGPPASTENSPVISAPVLIGTQSHEITPELENGILTATGVVSHQPLISPTRQDANPQGVSGPGTETDHEKIREEQAATKAQAAFRGFLARRAFHALKGIIRLQALVRGHLVRRQAVVTLRAMMGILKLQALARGQKDGESVDFRKNQLYRNRYIRKLLSFSLAIMPLQIQYDQREPNSVFSWMDRWTLSRFWKPLSKPKKTSNSKSQTKKSTYAMETESGKSKRNSKNNTINNINSEPEKPKPNMKKATISSEHPQSELEKVKRNLKKVETSEKSETQSDNKSHDSSINDSKEKTKKEVTPNLADLDIAVEKQPAELAEEETSLKEVQISKENRKTSKRRASFSAKPEHEENGTRNSPTLPSYMQATQSAKAKLRGQSSPRLGADSAEKNGFTRRHSLPSSTTNGKMTSHSPRTQRIIQAAGKAGSKGDRSLVSSRDGTDKPIQVEWRRY